MVNTPSHRPSSRLTIRGAVITGFFAIFALVLIFSYHLDRRLTDVEERGSSVHARFTDSEGLLLTVATQLLLGTVSVRDAFIDTTPGSISVYRQQLETARAEIERALRQYLSTVSSTDERERWTELRAELDGYWDEMLPTIAPEGAQNPEEARTFLRQRVVPRRRAILEIADQIRTLNRETYEQRASTVTELYRELRRATWGMGAVAIVLGLVVALAATRYAGRLESRIRQQHRQEAIHTRQLERLSAQLVRVQEEERRTIARDVHDEIGQALTAIKIELTLAQRDLAAAGYTSDGLQNARTMMDGALHAVRDVAQLLHPVTLDSLGLSETVRGYVRGFAQRTGIQADLTQSGALDRLGPDVEICVYRVIQEALTNVAKHARASACRVDLHSTPRAVIVTIEDNGIGMDTSDTPGSERSRGLGLIGLRERVSALGGTAHVTSAPGTGTRVRAAIPIRTVVAEADDGDPGDEELSMLEMGRER